VTDGRNLQWFEPFGPKALTGIGGLPLTLTSRSLRLRMRRRRRDESVDRFRRRRALDLAQPLHDGFVAWADAPGVIEALTEADPAMPEQLGDRQQDACELLVAIADLAGGDWPERGRAALVCLAEQASEAAAEESRGTLLLGDLVEAFAALGDRAATASLLDHLNALDERPWPSWNDGTGLRSRNLAAVLRPYGVRSTTVRLADDTRAKGYKREDFEDAFARYLGPASVTSVTPEESCGFAAHFDPLPDAEGNGFSEAANPHKQTGVTDVTDSGRGERPNGPESGDGNVIDADEVERLADAAREAQQDAGTE
jgi:hypothetical protein